VGCIVIDHNSILVQCSIVQCFVSVSCTAGRITVLKFCFDISETHLLWEPGVICINSATIKKQFRFVVFVIVVMLLFEYVVCCCVVAAFCDGPMDYWYYT